MSKVYINEYARIGLTERGWVQAPEEPAVATQVLDTSGGVQVSAAFNKETRFIRVHTDGIISFKFGAAPTAAITDARMGAGATEYFGVPQSSSDPSATTEGLKISAITNT